MQKIAIYALRLTCVPLVVLLAACQRFEGLVEGDYFGAPVLTFQVDLSGSSGALPASSRVLPLIFWSNTGTTTALDFKSSEGTLGRYTMELTRTLPESAYKRVVNRRKDRLIGRIILFEDFDDDGEWDADTETFVGGSNSHVVIFHNDPALEATQRYSLARMLGCMQTSGDYVEPLARQQASEELVTLQLAVEQSFNEDIDCDDQVDDPCLTLEQSMSQACQDLYARDCREEEKRLEALLNNPALIDDEHEDYARLSEELAAADAALVECYEALYPSSETPCEHMDQALCMDMGSP